MRIYDLFTTLVQTLEKEIPTIKYYDWWGNQHLFEDHYPFPVPACFIDINSPAMEDYAEHQQLIHLNISIYLLDTIPADSYGGDTVRLQTYQTLLQNIHNALHGKDIAGVSGITRTNFENITEQPGVYLFKQEFDGVTVQ